MNADHLFPSFWNTQMIHTCPKILKDWWDNISREHGSLIIKKIGNLVSLMDIQGDKGLIEALIRLWDPEQGVFRFPDCELCPTLEEISGFTNLTLDDRELIVPMEKCEKKFCKMFELNYTPSLITKTQGTISLKYLFDLFGRKGSYRANPRAFKCTEYKWEKLRPKAFVLALLGTLVFPCGYDAVDMRLSTVVRSVFEGVNGRQITLVPMILADILGALTECSKGGNCHFSGCNLLLQIWAVEHLHPRELFADLSYGNRNKIATHQERMADFVRLQTAKDWYNHLSNLSGSDIHWNYSCMGNTEVRLRGPSLYYIELIGFRGIQPYAPIRVMRQFGLPQSIPLIASMQDSEFKYTSPKYIVPESTKICNDWFHLQKEMISQNQVPACSPEYYAWARNNHKTGVIETSFCDQTGYVDKEAERHSRLYLLPKTIFDELMFDQVRRYPGYAGPSSAPNRFYRT